VVYFKTWLLMHLPLRQTVDAVQERLYQLGDVITVKLFLKQSHKLKADFRWP